MSQPALVDDAAKISLAGLNQRLRALLSAASVLSATSDENVEAELLQCYRKTAIADQLLERYVVAITGLQGAGKSTLLRELYEIPKEYLTTNPGRGEKLPILVTEHPGSAIECRAFCAEKEEASGNYQLVLSPPLTAEEFQQRACSMAPNDLWLELRVPAGHFSSGQVTLALLPGIEHGTDEASSDWQEFIRHCLTMAATCIIAFDSTRLAEQQGEELVQELLADFKSAKPIFALTHADQNTAEMNQHFRQTVMSRFGVPESEQDRVVLTGNEDYPRDWTDQLVRNVQAYSATPREFRRNQVQHLNQVIAQAFNAVRAVKEAMTEHNLTVEFEEDAELKNYLRHFDNAAENLKKSFVKRLTAELQLQKIQSMEQMRTVIAKRGGGHKTKKFLIGTTFKDHLEFVRDIQQAWEQPVAAGKTATASDAAPRSLSDRCSQAFSDLAATGVKDILVGAEAKSFVAAYQREQQAVAVEATQPFLDNLNQFFQPQTFGGTAVVLRPECVELIPLIVLQQVSIGVEYAPSVKEENGKLAPTGANEALTTKLKDLATSNGPLVSGIAILLGLDAMDGTVNTIPALLKVLGVEATTAAMSVAVAAFGLISLGFVVTNAIRQLTKQDFQDEAFAERLTDQLVEQYKTIVTNHYDDLMLSARKRLVRQLGNRLHKNESFVRWEQLRFTRAEVEDYLFKLRGLVYEHLHRLG